MSENLTPDLCVIGAGSGGLSVAAAAAAMSVPVVLVEKGEMGGDCLNYGCVPSKALIEAGKSAQAMRGSGKFGVEPAQPRIDMAQVRAHVRGVIASIAPNDSEARFTSMGVKVIRAAGKFTAKDTLEAGGFTIKARRFVIATGSSASAPPIPGLDQVRYLTNETIFDLDELPRRLVIIGGGPIGMELSQAFRRLGAAVTVIEASRALSREDPELAAVALAALRSNGVDIRENAKILRIEALASGAQVIIQGESGEEAIDCSHLLVAAGRTPNIHNLGLEAAGVDFSRKGITVGKDLRTTNRRIYAIGDVTGEAAFTHAANYHAGLVLRATLFRLPVKVQPQLIPRVTYTDPEIAVAGLTEAQARETNTKLNIYRWPLAENDRAQASHSTQGHIKIVASAKDVILGAGIAGKNAGELIALWQLAISKGMKVKDVANLVLPYPTISEVSKRAALTHYQKQLGNPRLGALLRFLRRFG
jgi:pyruvate/2-oxoglutarate dehydrogenase complex dihydrolipoamide dehydrogenase (E3) component